MPAAPRHSHLIQQLPVPQILPQMLLHQLQVGEQQLVQRPSSYLSGAVIVEACDLPDERFPLSQAPQCAAGCSLPAFFSLCFGLAGVSRLSKDLWERASETSPSRKK